MYAKYALLGALGFTLTAGAVQGRRVDYDLSDLSKLSSTQLKDVNNDLARVLNLLQNCDKSTYLDFGQQLTGLTLEVFPDGERASLEVAGVHPAPSFQKYGKSLKVSYKFLPRTGNEPQDAGPRRAFTCSADEK
ncbi:hypothetical protein K2X33_00735 [bacterium]|nr:hypothetical protein [bacterium]